MGDDAVLTIIWSCPTGATLRPGYEGGFGFPLVLGDVDVEAKVGELEAY